MKMKVLIFAELACDREIHYGHALSEIGNWYQDSTSFVDRSSSWIYRSSSSSSGAGAGVFLAGAHTGGSLSTFSSRFVLV